MTYPVLIGLAILFGLITAIFWIVLIVKVFKHAGPGLGILSIFCAPFTYIWGWVKSGQYKLTKLMLSITLLMLITAGCYAAAIVAIANDPEVQANLKKMQQEIQKSVDEAQKAQQQQSLPAPQN